MSTLTTAFHSFLTRLDEIDWGIIRAIVRLATVLMVLAMVAQGPVTDPADETNQTLALVRNQLFNFSEWEVRALSDKARVSLANVHAYMPESEREELVRQYLALTDDVHRLEDEVNRIYTDPAIADPDAASVSLRAERDSLRARQLKLQPVAEAVIQSQVAATFIDEGFGVGGHLFPPVQIRFTQLPRLLVVSPRDHIERIGNHPLQHDLTVDELDALEKRVDSQQDVSSLAVPLGGLAVYPAMLIESDYAPSIYDITAHEWAHHYLSFYPLGFNFGLSPDLFTMNETTANIVGEEIGRATLERHYPDLVPPPPAPPDPDAPPPPEPEPPAFDFREEMRLTRVRVDELLAEGEIEEAEDYMEERRQVFVEQGYDIRKLNQAYFAFYGSYADRPGAAGEDPIGPMIRELRDLSPSLKDFVLTMRSMTTREELEAAHTQAQAAHANP